jgi:hypothetical protein
MHVDASPHAFSPRSVMENHVRGVRQPVKGQGRIVSLDALISTFPYAEGVKHARRRDRLLLKAVRRVFVILPVVGSLG